MLREYLRNLKTKLYKPYRIEVIHVEKLYLTKMFLIKPITIILAGLLLVLGIIGGTASLIVFSPGIRKHIPGYHNPEYDQNQDSLLSQISMLEKALDAQETVLQSLRQFARPDSGTMSLDELSAENFPLSQITYSTANEVNTSSGKNGSTPAVNNSQLIESRTNSPNIATNVSWDRRSVFHPSAIHLFSPVEGKIRKKFNNSEPHYGIDIVANESELIRAATDGFVILKEFSESNGHVIGISSIQHDIVTFYKHNSRILKEVGDFVLSGEAIAVIGNSGENTTGPHLHFELWLYGKPVDPLEYYSQFNN